MSERLQKRRAYSKCWFYMATRVLGCAGYIESCSVLIISWRGGQGPDTALTSSLKGEDERPAQTQDSPGTLRDQNAAEASRASRHLYSILRVVCLLRLHEDQVSSQRRQHMELVFRSRGPAPVHRREVSSLVRPERFQPE